MKKKKKSVTSKFQWVSIFYEYPVAGEELSKMYNGDGENERWVKNN